jgi:predicted HTH transcriptional regulator
VWETRRDQVVGVRFINSLIAEWETMSVDFKRELNLDTASQKAEFVKDVIGLANTQASDRRWMIIGFDDKTREHYGPPNPSITQNRIEHILGDYVQPFVDVRYEVVDYLASKVGVLEVLRDAGKFPHSVAKSLGEKAAGDKKRIKEGQIFVRHGSQTEPPTPAELEAIREEAERAKSPGGA